MADQLDLQRIGRQHQAGSDSLLTGMAFFRMKEVMLQWGPSAKWQNLKFCHFLVTLQIGAKPSTQGLLGTYYIEIVTSVLGWWLPAGTLGDA